MSKFKILCCFAASSILLPNSAVAGPVIIKDLKRADSAWFYNKIGATTEDVSRDEYNCTAFGHYMFTMSPYNDGDPYVAHSGIVGSVIGGAVSSGPIRGTKDDCMMSLGYTRYNTSDKSMKSFKDRYETLSTSEKDAYHGSAVPPEGKATRKWVNTFWISNEGKPSVEEREYMPERFDIMKSEKLKSIKPSFWNNPSLMTPLDFDELDTIPHIQGTEDKSIVIVKVLPVSGKPADIRFSRVDPATGDPYPIIGKKGKGKIPTLVISAKHKTIDGYNVYEVPSGSYALSYTRYHAMCMKTVITEFKAGETTYLGEYTGFRNKESVHSMAPTPRVRIRFDQDDTSELPESLTGITTPVAAVFKNNFEMKCPAILGEKMYGIRFPGHPDFNPY